MSKIKAAPLIIAVTLFCLIWACAGLLNNRVERPQIKGATYVGTQKCIEEKCHPKRITDIEHSSHSKLFIQESPDKPACEMCHGPGSLHIGSTKDPELILIYKKMSPKQQSEVCLTCHASGSLEKWYNSAHYQKDISCNECHLSHGSDNKPLLKQPDPDICYKCHAEVQQKFKLSSTHWFKDQGFRCSLCHESHEKRDTSGKAVINRTVCLECHKQYAAVYEYKHEPVEKDCLQCHVAHGSNYPKLCNSDTTTLCKSCHSVKHRIFLVNRFYTDAEKKLKSGQCVICHKMIHGSENESLLNRKPPSRGRPAGFVPPIETGGGTGGMQKAIEMQQQQFNQ
jgi:DmsE family decaheme c-type cytochrome